MCYYVYLSVLSCNLFTTVVIHYIFISIFCMVYPFCLEEPPCDAVYIHVLPCHVFNTVVIYYVCISIVLYSIAFLIKSELANQ